MSTPRRLRPAVAAAVVLLVGCASVSPEAQREAVGQWLPGRTGGVAVEATTLGRTPDGDSERAITDWLAEPLSAEAAVKIALMKSPSLQGSFAMLQISDADRVQASLLPNPHFAFSRLVEGETLELERLLRFDVIGLLTLPWRMRWQNQQNALAQLQAAQDVIRLAADTRKAWVSAVAAQQSADYAATAKEATEAAAELAHRMARVGNWSRYQQAKEQTQLAEATAQLARARQTAFAARERLTRLMGLWGQQSDYRLPTRLPDLPASLTEPTEVEARALRERLDVRAARDQSRYVAASLGYTRATGYVGALEFGVKNKTFFDNASGTRDTAHGWELDVPLPIFDWGSARNARAEALYLQSAARVRDVALRARSEAREAWHGWRTAYDLARHYRDEIVPLRKFINDETVLRYNGMLLSVWDLLADTRQNALAVASAIEAQRDFWLADTDLQTALTGTSPGGLQALLAAPGAGSAAAPQGH